MTRYPAKFKQTRTGFTVTFPDLSEIVTEGRTWEEALRNAEEALTLGIEARLEAGNVPPRPSLPATAIFIAPSAKAQSAMLFRWHRGDVSKAELGRRLDTSAWSRINDLEVGANITLDRAERASRALGFRLVLSYEKEPQP